MVSCEASAFWEGPCRAASGAVAAAVLKNASCNPGFLSKPQSVPSSGSPPRPEKVPLGLSAGLVSWNGEERVPGSPHVTTPSPQELCFVSAAFEDLPFYGKFLATVAS